MFLSENRKHRKLMLEEMAVMGNSILGSCTVPVEMRM